jgi:hypothetical protein
MRKLLPLPLCGPLCACALTAGTIAPPAQSVRTGLEGGGERPVLVLAGWADERPVRTRCGMKKNGYNMDTADMRCAAEPAQWLPGLLATELKAAGFAVLQAPSPDALAIEGHLLQFFVEPKVGAFTFSPEADVHVRLVVTSTEGLRAERSFYVKGIEESLAGLDSNFQAASDSAVRAVLKDMVAAILALSKRYPPTGVAAAAPKS